AASSAVTPLPLLPPLLPPLPLPLPVLPDEPPLLAPVPPFLAPLPPLLPPLPDEPFAPLSSSSPQALAPRPRPKQSTRDNPHRCVCIIDSSKSKFGKRRREAPARCQYGGHRTSGGAESATRRRHFHRPSSCPQVRYADWLRNEVVTARIC